tara:strand:- start:938 stop:1537 length:600 start_codon:yes stop_codon:yes gene_type:complete
MRRGAISLAGFAEKFDADADPWDTWSARYEAVKRGALAKAIGAGRFGRGIELAAGNGSNTPMIAQHTRRLIATEGTRSGTELVRQVAADLPRVRVVHHDVAARLPGNAFDLIVIAELLYYLGPQPFAMLAAEVSRTLVPGGRLVLLHHAENFPDRARSAARVHRDFMARLGGVPMKKRHRATARRWRVEAWERGLGVPS